MLAGLDHMLCMLEAAFSYDQCVNLIFCAWHFVLRKYVHRFVIVVRGFCPLLQMETKWIWNHFDFA